MRPLRLLFAALTATAMLHARADAEPIKIRLSWVAPISNLGSVVLEKKDLLKHFGQSYVLEPVRYQGTPNMITALATGELEIADLAYSTLPIAIQNAGLDDLRVISDEFQDGVDDYYSNEYFVLADSPIQKVEDLKGKLVATNVAGSAVDIASRAMLRKHGLEDKRDYTVFEAPFPTMRALLAERKVDLIPAVRPFSLDPELKKISRNLFTTKDAVGRTQFISFQARKAFIDKNRAALVDLLEDLLRVQRWFIDPTNNAAAAEIAGRVMKAPAERFSWIFTKQDYFRDPNMLPDLAALQRNVDLTRDLGFVKSSIEVKRYADLSLIEEAAKR